MNAFFDDFHFFLLCIIIFNDQPGAYFPKTNIMSQFISPHEILMFSDRGIVIFLVFEKQWHNLIT